MKLKVKVIPNTKENKVLEENDGFKVYIKSPPVGGKANKELITVLAEFFQIRKSDVRIIRGERARKKVIQIKKGENQ
jgi:hypothetical protein